MDPNRHASTSRDSLLRLSQVHARVGLSRASIYSLIKQDLFPAPVSLSARAIAFRESEISEWIASRPSAR